MDIASLRRSYSLSSLTKNEVSKSPIEQFRKWFKEALAANVPEPNAMTFASVSEDGKPHARVLLLKDCLDDGFVFYTNYSSAKADEIKHNPNGAICFLWLELQRQVRIEGILEKNSEKDAREYFKSRPIESQLGAWASNQSETIENRAVLDQKYSTYQEKFKSADEIPKPEDWGGYILKPEKIEFWQGRMSRLHDRLLYTKDKNGSWAISRLSP
jgi:pyridoxamine 5'-phosphate oxidase